MGYITYSQSQSYTVRHPDWLSSQPWRTLAETTGQTAEYAFYLKQEAKAKAIDTTFPLDSWINPLTWLQNWLIEREKQHYNENHVLEYDNAALQVLKSAEQIANLVNQARGEFNNLVQNAQAQLNSVISPIKSQIDSIITPTLNKAKIDLANAQQQLSGLAAGIGNAQNQAAQALNSASQAVQNAATALTSVQNVTATVQQAQNQAAQALNNIQNVSKTVNQIIGDLSAKTQQINSILTRLQTLEQKASSTPTPKSILSFLKPS